jgi:hypothetical protein
MITETQLYSLVIAAIQAGLVAFGIPVPPAANGVVVKQRYQPTTQGTPSGPAIFIHTEGPQFYGYPSRKDVFDSVSGAMVHTESQVCIATFQITGAAIQDQTNPAAVSVGDLVKAAALILNSDAARISLRSSGLAVERITQIRKTHYKDDKSRFEEDPTFDCSFVYTEVNTSANPATDKVTVTLYPIN